MAGEQKGKAYEALTKLILENLKVAGKLSTKGDIFWDEKPDAMSIVPDLSIGRSANSPSVILLITHSGSAKNSDMKFWRNIGELVEAKVFLASPPRVFNLAFDSVIKENLKLVQEASFDGQLIVGDQPYGADLQVWIDDNLKSFPKDKNEKVEYVRKLIKTDKVLKSLIGKLSIDLEVLLSKKAPRELDGIWAMERSRRGRRAPGAKETFARRGLSKLLIFEDIDVPLRLFSGKRVKQDEVPEYAYELGLAEKGIARKGVGFAKPNDIEIENAVSLLSDSQIRSILAQAPVDKMEGWLLTLRNSPHLTLMGSYVIDNFDDLVKAKELEVRLKKLHKGPNALVSKYALPKNWPPKTVWLFDLLVELVKLIRGNPTAYGLAGLEGDCSKLKGMPSQGDAIYRTTIPGWTHRRKAVQLPANILKGISEVLSDHLSSVSVTELKKLLSADNLRAYLQNVIEVKLCTYRGFAPLEYLISNNVGRSSSREHIRSCFGERAKVSGQTSKTTVMKLKNTLINWQSCHGSHTNDKKKELSGRAVGLRYSWDPDKEKFALRPGVKKLILVVDGTWRQKDLDTLVRAGWDAIYYPDEMDLLAKALRKSMP